MEDKIKINYPDSEKVYMLAPSIRSCAWGCGVCG